MARGGANAVFHFLLWWSSSQNWGNQGQVIHSECFLLWITVIWLSHWYNTRSETPSFLLVEEETCRMRGCGWTNVNLFQGFWHIMFHSFLFGQRQLIYLAARMRCTWQAWEPQNDGLILGYCDEGEGGFLMQGPEIMPLPMRQWFLLSRNAVVVVWKSEVFCLCCCRRRSWWLRSRSWQRGQRQILGALSVHPYLEEMCWWRYDLILWDLVWDLWWSSVTRFCIQTPHLNTLIFSSLKKLASINIKQPGTPGRIYWYWLTLKVQSWFPPQTPKDSIWIHFLAQVQHHIYISKNAMLHRSKGHPTVILDKWKKWWRNRTLKSVRLEIWDDFWQDWLHID